MDITFGDIQETALIPLAIKASETARPSARIRDKKAKAIIDALGVDVSKYDPFLSHEGVVARTIMFRDTLKDLLWAELNSESNKLQTVMAEETLVHRDKDLSRMAMEMMAEGEDEVEFIDDAEVEDLDDFEYEEEDDK